MAVCDACGEEMLVASGCTADQFDDFADGIVRDRIRFGDEQRFAADKPTGSCHDCAADVGHYHHPGCDTEECPKCHGQAIACACCDREGS